MFGNTPRIIGASIIAFWCGSFVNSYVLAKMKIWTQRPLAVDAHSSARRCAASWSTRRCSTRIAFGGLWPTATCSPSTTTQYVLKSAWEVLATPLTYRVVAFLKRAEHEDYYDRDTDFTPFSLQA